MQIKEPFFRQYKQHDKLPVRLISPTFGHLPAGELSKYGLTQRKTYYFLILVLEGSTRHSVDLKQFDIKTNELLFILPHQIHELPSANQAIDYFKIGIDESCLSMLPKQYPFLVNPLNQQKIRFEPQAAARLKSIFGNLADLLSDMNSDSQLILAHLNSLLAEINAGYFATDKNLVDGKLSKYIGFKEFVENNLSDHPTIRHIAQALSLNTNSLYNIVKHYSGLSPKEFITNRLILEAKRRIYYSESRSIKELAYELGFNDPEYFSRLFKKETGQTMSMFVQDLSGM
ncbi:helix-turn-helix domain-containing protein [Dyadobacter pollutisoli]|jgi:AraC-like DNA-binding protein|uniref:Helix-turn-helix transcriptional regulator n=1 Tax=Dyadobacter pollutisoli TaxID=2910158 RepID=A0A9E8NBC8_9BACT|nr:helix-turn-helix domain-containing protein [Dyadobacter pollutisoli]WAC11426.1 helix-turn-helix transcriptional regulator [Dyadobacter pollutisoli]